MSSTHSGRVDSSTELFIDVLRGFAALMVFCTHAVDLAISQVHGWEFGENPSFWRLIRAIFGTGEYWVWCFFVISGFCIHLSIARSLREGRFKVGSYTLARITRIYPIYLIGLTLAIATWFLVPHIGGYDGHNPLRQFWATLFSLQIFTNTFPGYEASWSLSCEMLYYAAWPVLLLTTRSNVHNALRLGMITSLLVAGLILLLWSHYHWLEDRAFVDGIWTVSALFVLWLGGVWLAEDWQKVSPLITSRLWISGMMVFATSVAFLFTLRYEQYPAWSIHTAAWASLPGLFLLIAGARHSGLETASVKTQAFCRWLGQFSYPCYLLHLQLLHLVDEYLLPWLPKAVIEQPLARVTVYAITVLPLLALIGPPLERALMAWRARLLRGSSLRPAAATT